MTEPWDVFIESARPARDQMARDEALAQETWPIVRLFMWNPPAVSLGLKQARPAWLRAERWTRAGLEWVERPTGGGIALHGSDVSVAIIVPRALGMSLRLLMETACRSTVSLCASFGVDATALLEAPTHGRVTYCLMHESPYAVLAEGQKLAGFAVRRYPGSWLLQGSMLARPLPTELAAALPEDVRQAVAVRATSLETACGSRLDLEEVARRWADRWAEWWEDALLCQMASAAP